MPRKKQTAVMCQLGCDKGTGRRKKKEGILTPYDEESRKGAGSAVVLRPGGLPWCYPRHDDSLAWEGSLLCEK